MSALTEAEIISMMREEWVTRVTRLMEVVDVSLKSNSDDLLSPSLKVIHKNSGIKYTIHSISPRDVILLTPEGEKFMVDKHELESDYALA